MIFAVSELKEPFRRDAGRRRRRIHTREAALQIVDAEHGRIAFALKGDPAFVHAQRVEHGRQSIIVAIARLDRFAETTTQGPLVGPYPRLDVREPVVRLGDDESQPDNRHLSQTQPRPMAVGREMFVQ